MNVMFKEMTGRFSLRGLVLPVEGVCDKFGWSLLIMNEDPSRSSVNFEHILSVHKKRGCVCVDVSPLNSNPIGLEFIGPYGP